MLEHFALLLAAALSVAGVDGACWDYGQVDCLFDEDGSLCVWIDSWDSCETACSEFSADWECDGSYCSWSYEDGVCETGCVVLSEDECSDSGCVWVQDWHECKETCEGREEENCHDQCSWDYDDEICETNCEYSNDDGCWFEGGSYDLDDDHRDCFSNICIHLRPVATSRPPEMSSSRAGRYELRERLLRVDGLGRARDLRRRLLPRAGLPW